MELVWCRFPQRPRDVPGPKPRPALVISITEHEDQFEKGARSRCTGSQEIGRRVDSRPPLVL